MIALAKKTPLATPDIKRVTILGATGSIGKNTVDLISRTPERFAIEALTAQDNVAQLIALCEQLRPRYAAIGNLEHYDVLKSALMPLGIEAGAGESGLSEAASRPADWVMAAIVGMAGLRPTWHAIERGATVALANKECLVAAGRVMIEACRKSGATLLPVDSEHNAIFQVLDRDQQEMVDRITLTASGGPLLRTPLHALANVTPQQAVAHPNWSMGAKISVDSATMMNKGLELIEAHYLFGMDAAKLEAIVHPESIVHSLVHYRDGSVLAQMAMPDMRTPIAYTLAWPQRMEAPTPRLDLTALGSLHFMEAEADRFPCLGLAQNALKAGGSAAITLNAANEIAVQAFLEERLRFTGIAEAVEKTLAQLPPAPVESLDDVWAADDLARRTATLAIESLS